MTQGDLNKLLLSDNEVSDIVGGPSLQTSQNYSEILGPKSETMSDNSCAETAFNTMWTACNGSGYTGVEGRRIGREGDTDSYLVDQGVVSFLDPGAARRFLDRTVQGWDHCAAVRFSVTDPGPPPSTDTYILGTPGRSGDISAVVNHIDDAEGYVCGRAVTSRVNVLIDVLVCGKGVAEAQPVAVVNGIVTKMH